MKVVSGGQTGVDRAALDAALEMNIAVGGWCPAGRKAEDGLIPGRYPVTELSEAGYSQRTKRNVSDSEGTVIIYFDYPNDGAELTLLCCIKERKPYVLIDASELSVECNAKKIKHFVQQYSIKVLNVAGPRASDKQKAYQYTKQVISQFLEFSNSN